MTQPLDELYLVWLYGQNASINTKSRSLTYWNLCRELFTTEFTWFVPNDDARLEDGKALRVEFMKDAEIPEVDPDWLDMGCSFMEVLVALSRRASFQTDIPASEWFWILIRNLGLDECNDTYNRNLPALVKEVTDQVIDRTYDTDGRGGLFPLRMPRKDQTRVELWYQLSAYILENE